MLNWLLSSSIDWVIPPRVFVSTTDFSLSADWYSDVLGFVATPQRSGVNEGSAIRLLPMVGPLQDVCLVNAKSRIASHFDQTRQEIPLCLLINTPLERVLSKMEARSSMGFQMERKPRHTPSLLLCDPNGYSLRVASIEQRTLTDTSGVSIWMNELASFRMHNIVYVQSGKSSYRIIRTFLAESLGITQSAKGGIAEYVLQEEIDQKVCRSVTRKLRTMLNQLEKEQPSEDDCLDGTSLDIWMRDESEDLVYLSLSSSTSDVAAKITAYLRQLSRPRFPFRRT
jgi:hypothetical protein